MFIIDDATPLGIALPLELMELFGEDRRVVLLNAEDLAKELSDLVQDFKSPVLVGGGGVLTYTLLTRFGYRKAPKIIDVSRSYVYKEGEKRPQIVFSVNGDLSNCKNCIDDIIASGATISQLGEDLRASILILSSQSRGRYRKKEGSTIRCVDELFTAQRVNCDKGFPAIFSSRFLVRQVINNPEYLGYVSKYVDPQALLQIIKDLDIQPFDMLYGDPVKFIQKYGG